jgi:hypothetical protein
MALSEIAPRPAIPGENVRIRVGLLALERGEITLDAFRDVLSEIEATLH